MEKIYFFSLLIIAVLAIIASGVYATVLKLKPYGNYKLPIGTIISVTAFFSGAFSFIFLPNNNAINSILIFWGLVWLMLSICNIIQLSEIRTSAGLVRFHKEYWLLMAGIMCQLISYIMLESVALKIF